MINRIRGAVSLVFTLLLAALAASPSQAANATHKLVASPGVIDETRPGVQLLADYGTFRLYRVTDQVLDGLPRTVRDQVSMADDMDIIQIDAQPVNTRTPVVNLPAALQAAPSTGASLHLVQFVGPIKQQWLDELSRIGV